MRLVGKYGTKVARDIQKQEKIEEVNRRIATSVQCRVHSTVPCYLVN